MAEVYCGPAPVPSELASSWNPDPVALLLCLAIAVAWVIAGRADRVLPLTGGILLLTVLFLSPLCALTAALFSARALHHVLLVAVAAPLLAIVFPRSGRRAVLGIGWVAGIHAVVFWVWHAPAVYEIAITNPVGYWTMQVSLLGTGFWLWRRVFDPGEAAGPVLLALLATVVQMGMLGALLTFATTPLYAPHLVTTLPFGMSPLQDQQLAGILMWVPAALPYLAAALLRAWPLLGPSGRSARWSG
jgi:putative membrane protein